MRTLYTFNGGVHPPQHKDESNALPIARVPLPARLVVALRQHIGVAARALVKPGDVVLKGQMIGAADTPLCAAVHAPTSGRVSAVEAHPVAHPSALPDLCVTIEADGEERWVERQPFDYRDAEPAALRRYLRDAGVVGLGGAVFPTHLKLDPGAAARIATLVVNGAECEPWITADDRLMREHAADIVAGIAVMVHLVQPEEVLIGIEDNKPQAIAAMQAACAGTSFEVVAIPTVYPGGGEKQLIRVLTGKEVPSGQRPLNVGVVCVNVATAHAVKRAVLDGEPLIERVVTVTGAVARAQNFLAPLGMALGELVALAGGASADTRRYIVGGPMMGFDAPSLAVPLGKTVNCLIAAAPALFPPPPPALPCIRCGRCAQSCPADLQPQELYWFAQSRNFAKARAYHLFDCIECGCCSYVCPSSLPLVDFFRYAKAEIAAQERDKRAADVAGERYAFKQARIEREKRQRAETIARKQAAAQAAATADPQAEAKKAAIRAAMERVKAAQQAGEEDKSR